MLFKERLKELTESIESNPNYKKILRFGDKKLKEEILKELRESANTTCQTVQEGEGETQKKVDSVLREMKYGYQQNQAVYEDVAGESSGCISYVNKYQHVALDFIERYPFTKFMDGRQIDYQTSLIRDNIQLNAYMVGFNETNQHIFLASVANNQFLCQGKNGRGQRAFP